MVYQSLNRLFFLETIGIAFVRNSGGVGVCDNLTTVWFMNIFFLLLLFIPFGHRLHDMRQRSI